MNAVAENAVNYDVGLIIGTSSVLADDRIREYTSPAEMISAGFTAESAEYAAAVLYFNQSPAPRSVYVGYKGSGESFVDAINACFEANGSFWGVYCCAITAQDILDVDECLTKLNHGMLFFTEANASNAASESGTFATLRKRNSRRAAGILSDSAVNAAAWMGSIAGLHTAHAADAFSACYRSLNGVATSDLTEKQVEAIEAQNGNVYVTRGYRYNVVEHASTGSGLRIDEVLYLDSMASDLRTAMVGLIVNSANRLPQNDSTSTLFISTVNSVLNNYANRGIIGTGVWDGNTVGTLENGDMVENGYYVYIEPYSMQTAADRAEHKALPVNVCVCMTGSVESVEITVNVQR